MAFFRKLARGQSERTAPRALGAVAVVVFSVAGLVIAAALLIYFLV